MTPPIAELWRRLRGTSRNRASATQFLAFSTRRTIKKRSRAGGENSTGSFRSSTYVFVTFPLASLTICLQTELAIDTNAAVLDTHNVVSDTQNVVSNTHNIVSDTHNIASDTHNIVSDIRRAVVKHPEASNDGNPSVSNHHPLLVTTIYRCLDSDKVCGINFTSFYPFFLCASLSRGGRRACVTHCER